MIQRIARVLLIIALCYLSSFTMYSKERVTLEECYEWVEQNYPLVAQYELIDKAREFDLSNARRAWLPSISIHGQASWQSEVTKLPFNSKLMSDLIPGFENPEISKDQYKASLNVDQTIWDGGATRAQKSIVEKQAQSDRASVDSKIYELRSRVNQLFFGCLLQQTLIAQNDLLQEQLSVNLQQVEALKKNGMANDVDVDAIIVEQLTAAQKGYELEMSYDAYLDMLGAFTGKTFTKATWLLTPSRIASFSSVISRPELEMYKDQEELLSQKNKLLKAGLMPKFGLFLQGGYGRPGLDMLNNEFEPFLIGGIRFNWDIGRFYTLKNDRKKIDNAISIVETQRKTFLFETELQLMKQQVELRNLEKLIRADDKIVELRHKQTKAAEIKLDYGVISTNDLIRIVNAESLARETAAMRLMTQLMQMYQIKYIINQK